MGSEQSREVVLGTEVPSQRAKSGTGTNDAGSSVLEDELCGRDSPRPSISSDADLPYISYTVNRPIGDSPKHTNKGVRVLRGAGGGGSPRRLRKRVQRPQEVVVVREGNSNNASLDPELARLQSIPTFLPIMRGALTAPSARDPEVLERLDSGSLFELCRRYQAHLNQPAALVSSNQERITSKIREVDAQVNTLATSLKERQVAYARYADKISQVTEVSYLLTHCHSSLNLILESLDTLNEFLPVEERLEPFIWTTG